MISRLITQENTFQSHHKPIVLKRTPIWNNAASTVLFNCLRACEILSLALGTELPSASQRSSRGSAPSSSVCALRFALLQHELSTRSPSPPPPKTPGIFLLFFLFVLHISNKRAPSLLLSTYTFSPSFEHQCRFHFL